MRGGRVELRKDHSRVCLALRWLFLLVQRASTRAWIGRTWPRAQACAGVLFAHTMGMPHEHEFLLLSQSLDHSGLETGLVGWNLEVDWYEDDARLY